MVLILVIAVVVVIGAPVLFKLSEQAKNFPAFSIGISFSQTLGLFSIQLDYPPYLRHLLSYFSFFNLNLELVHPECSLGRAAQVETRVCKHRIRCRWCV